MMTTSAAAATVTVARVGTTVAAGAVGAAAGGAGAVGATTAGVGLGLELPVGVGEDCRTLGRKLCPPCVFTMAGLEKEKRWRGGEGRRFQK